jgi:hypothetical protein
MLGRKLIALLLCGVLAIFWTASVSAGQKIRMYKINSKLQQSKIVLGGAVKKAGCHDLLWGKQVYRFVQLGYAWCSVYAQDGCAADSIVTALWSDGDYKRYNIDEGKPQEKLYPGTKWIIDASADDIQSWYCEAK